LHAPLDFRFQRNHDTRYHARIMQIASRFVEITFVYAFSKELRVKPRQKCPVRNARIIQKNLFPRENPIRNLIANLIGHTQYTYWPSYCSHRTNKDIKIWVYYEHRNWTVKYNSIVLLGVKYNFFIIQNIYILFSSSFYNCINNPERKDWLLQQIRW